MPILEALMLLCFGAAWPFSIARSYRSRSTSGKSATFLFVVLVGYLAGIANKLFSNPGDFVLYLYVLNLLMVTADTLLFFRNRRIERSVR